MPNPTVDIVTPAFNESPSALQVTVGAALAQEGVRARVFIVDDASPEPISLPNTTLGEHATVYRLAVNGGPSAARNAGAGLGTAEWIAFLDVEVVPPVNWLSASIAYLTANTKVGLVTVEVQPKDPESVLGRWRALVQEPPVRDESGPVPWAAGHALVLRRETFARTGGFDSRLRVAEDVAFSRRVMDLGLSVDMIRPIYCASIQNDSPVQLAKAEFARFLGHGEIKGRLLPQTSVAVLRALYRSFVHVVRGRPRMLLAELRILPKTLTLVRERASSIL